MAKDIPNSVQTVIGLRLGGSLDGIDAALTSVRFADDGDVTLDAIHSHRTIPIPDRLRTALKELSKTVDLEELSRLNFRVGIEFAHAALQTLADAGMTLKNVDLCALSGYSAIENFARKDIQIGFDLGHSNLLTVGDPSVVSEALGLPVAAAFDSGVLAAGGNRLDVFARAERALFQYPDDSVALVTLGGIVRMATIPSAASRQPMQKWEVCPGMIFHDELVAKATIGDHQTDANGELSSRGELHYKTLKYLMSHEAQQQKPPRLLPRRYVAGRYFVDFWTENVSRDVRPSDMITSMSIFIAQAVARDFVNIARPQLGDISTLVVSGGANNAYIAARLQTELSPLGDLSTMSSADFNIPHEALGAISTAIVGALRYAELPNVVTLGAGNVVRAGTLTLPSERAQELNRTMTSDDLASRIRQFRDHGFDHFNIESAGKPSAPDASTPQPKALAHETQRLDIADLPLSRRATDAGLGKQNASQRPDGATQPKPDSVMIDLSSLDDEMPPKL